MNEIRNTPLTKKERNRLYLRYLLFGCPGVDAIYIQGKSWPWWLLPFFKLYYNAQQIKENILRHFTWYNTEPIAGSLIFGIVLGMEEEKAIHDNVDPETIIAIKSGLMGPVAGIGDSLVQATLIPILITLTACGGAPAPAMAAARVFSARPAWKTCCAHPGRDNNDPSRGCAHCRQRPIRAGCGSGTFPRPRALCPGHRPG